MFNKIIYSYLLASSAAYSAPLTVTNETTGMMLSLKTYWGSNAQEIDADLSFTNGPWSITIPKPYMVKSSNCTVETCPEGSRLTQTFDCAASSSCSGNLTYVQGGGIFDGIEYPAEILGVERTDRICIDADQTMCTLDTQPFVEVYNYTEAYAPYINTQVDIIPGEMASVNLAKALYDNNVGPSYTSAFVHIDNQDLANSTIEFNPQYPRTWTAFYSTNAFGGNNSESMWGWDLRLFGSNHTSLDQDYEMNFAQFPGSKLISVPDEIRMEYYEELTSGYSCDFAPNMTCDCTGVNNLDETFPPMQLKFYTSSLQNIQEDREVFVTQLDIPAGVFMTKDGDVCDVHIGVPHEFWNT